MIPAKLAPFIISPNGTLHQALEKIEANLSRSLIVVTEEGKVVGTISDGDIRKQLLGNHTLMLPVHEGMNLHFRSAHKQDEASTIFQNFPYIELLPIISKENVLLGIIKSDMMPVE